MPFTAWSLFTDLGLIALLLLLGQLVRAHLALVQRLFLPANVLAGLTGLVLGPHALDLLPFSDSVGTYPGILIALIFASLPFSSGAISVAARRRPVGELCAYSTLVIFLQWGAGLLFGLVLLRSLWPALHPGFGAILASGFVGGHGTAAAIGSAFAERGWPEAGSLAMTAATVGIGGAIVGGDLRHPGGGQIFVSRIRNLDGGMQIGYRRHDLVARIGGRKTARLHSTCSAPPGWWRRSCNRPQAPRAAPPECDSRHRGFAAGMIRAGRESCVVRATPRTAAGRPVRPAILPCAYLSHLGAGAQDARR